MDNFLTNIALANALYEENKNYFDAYFPFILKLFIESKTHNLKNISEKLKDNYDIELPIHSIQNILIEKDKDIIQINKSIKKNWVVCLSDKGTKELAELLDYEKKIERRITRFHYECMTYCNNLFGNSYTKENIQELVKKFLINHLVEVSIYSDLSKKMKISSLDGFEKQFILFLNNINEQASELCEVFEEIWKGVIIWNELSKHDDIKKYERNFEGELEVFIDTNYIISLLELHSPIVNQAAKELHSLLLENPRIKLKVLDSTIDETEHLFDLYEYFKNDFFDIKVDSVFYYLKTKNYTKIKIEQLKRSLVSRLHDLQIEYVPVGDWNGDFQKYYPYIYEHVLKLRSERNNKSNYKKNEIAIEKSSHHDSVVLSYILARKNKAARSLYNCRAVFLTGSYYLVKNYKKISYRFEKYPAIIMDSSLTNYLYLLSPNKNCHLKLNQVLKAHSKYLLVDSRIWQNYIATLKDLLKEEKISFEDYTKLLSSNRYTNEYLLENLGEEIKIEKVEEILDQIKEEDIKKQDEIIKLRDENEKSQTVISKKDETIESQNKRIEEISKRLELIEEENRKERSAKEEEIKEAKFKEKCSEDYFDFVNQAQKIVRNYLIFLFIAISIKVIEQILPTITILKIISINSILSIFVFLVPFIRSFFKHDKVLEAFKLTFSVKYRNARKIIFENSRREENGFGKLQ
ncbi:MAG: hypothetical protein PQJ44_07620 [Sphaerochaetaceae bacterium]|nr:hypothetical protein [Sphaerochaetaceae bacterium]